MQNKYNRSHWTQFSPANLLRLVRTRRGVAPVRLVEGITEIDMSSIVVCEQCGSMRRMYLMGNVHRTGRQMHLLLLTLVVVVAAPSRERCE